METINQPALPQSTDDPRNTAPQRKGGFVQGAAAAQGCCGEPGSSGGCCGAPAQAAVPAATIQSAAQGGCCGAPASQTKATPSSGCCG